jgi:hypothetical protein
LFAARFVLIGFNSTGLQDRVVTPLGESLPGVDIHAQVIESLLAGEALQRPYWATWMELGILLASGLLLIGFLPILRAAMRWRFCRAGGHDHGWRPSGVPGRTLSVRCRFLILLLSPRSFPCSATPWSPPMPGDAGPSGNCNRAGRKRHA